MMEKIKSTPCYVIDEAKLRKNLEILQYVEREAGCHILLAQKAFSAYPLYPLIGRYISGTTASGLYEARLGKEEMGKENHVFSPAYKEQDIDEIASVCDHVIFNSFAQFEKYRGRCGNTSIGIRINPECSTQKEAIYDPCAPGSRLGVTKAEFEKYLSRKTGESLFQKVQADQGLLKKTKTVIVENQADVEQKESMSEEEKRPDSGDLPKIEGLHFHTLCEQNADDLETTFAAVEEKFGPWLRRVKWLNMGGGHHITREDYDVERLISLVRRIRETYGVEVYLEPGEAVALNAGYLVTEVLDIVENGLPILILDASAACHMPDVLEMPYRPPLAGGFPAGEKPYTYRLSSCTCLAGDIIGDYSFEHPVRVGDRLVFEDMAIYTMVKNNTFNGMPLPSIAVLREDGTCEVLREFGYEEFKGRLG
ncbi:MAG: carboxynorspermidine decarboxylase [Lachnospiraceae bacterium]|nr:carboxynorspermidine decarboxylase [Lachnospiraceae bacterium]